MIKLRLVGARSYSNRDKIRCLQGEVIEIEDTKKAEYLLKTGLFEKVEEKASKR
jgi:hypothetical protein